MSRRTDLFIIDPQIDFCRPGTGPNDPKRGALYVDGAEQDMTRVAAMIDRYGSKITNIHVTLDCHHLIDVAHPGMWRNSDGKNPDFFTIISSSDIKKGVWLPIIPALTKRFISYCESLESTNRYPLCIWPPHCLIGSEGNAVLPVLFEALVRWSKLHNNNVNYVSKGSNPFTEHYSAIKAEVPDPSDVTTQINVQLIETLKNSDHIMIAGEAGSHCLKNTVEDTADGFKDDSCVSKMTLLTDGTSPVISPYVDFPAIQASFISNMKARGMKTALTTDF